MEEKTCWGPIRIAHNQVGGRRVLGHEGDLSMIHRGKEWHLAHKNSQMKLERD